MRSIDKHFGAPTVRGDNLINDHASRSFRDFLVDDRAQALVEYALIIVVVVLGTLVALSFLRDQLIAVFSQTGNLL
ncbi:MAG: Flp family type IVb pilin [Gaiellaceae bacterium]